MTSAPLLHGVDKCNTDQHHKSSVFIYCRGMMEEADSDDKRILAQFKSENGDVTGNAFDLPLNVTAEKLQLICNALLTNVSVKVLLAEIRLDYWSDTFTLSQDCPSHLCPNLGCQLWLN